MLFMNEMDIEDAVINYREHPVVGQASRFLSRFAEMINQNSDGWPYWRQPVKAAEQLMSMIESHRVALREHRPSPATPEAFKKALRPIKAFCTKHNLPMPALG